MKVKLSDLNPQQVQHMKGLYGLSDQQVLESAQRIVDPSELLKAKASPFIRPSRRGRRFRA